MFYRKQILQKAFVAWLAAVLVSFGADIDMDGMPDGFELEYTNPASATSLDPTDDLELGGVGDGLSNLEEFMRGTNPLNEDSDGDTLLDGDEIIGTEFVPATDPLNPDTDNDGLGDEVETNLGDFVSSINTGTSPIFKDTDGDGFNDGVEVAAGTNPTSSLSAPHDLIRYWKFDGNFDEEVILDSGVPIGAPNFTTDRFGILEGALALNESQYVSWEDGSGLNNLQIGTISLWVRWSGIQDTGLGGSYGAVVGRQWDGIGSNQILSLDGSDPSTATITWKAHGGEAGDINVTGSTVVGDGVWRHVVVTYRNGRHQLYVDGNLEGTDFFATGMMVDEASGLMPMTVGAWIGEGGAFSTAAIDDLRLYGGVLPEAEVIALGLDADEDGLPDSFELEHSDGTTSSGMDPQADLDSDGLNNLEEFQNVVNPNVADSDLDGLTDGVEVAFKSDPDDISSLPTRSIARVWNEQNIAAIRNAFPDPPVHAWNLFHTSVAMWDAWAIYDSVAVGYLHRETAAVSDIEAAREVAISYAAYRVLSRRYYTIPHPLTPVENSIETQRALDDTMRHLGLNPAITTTVGLSPEAVGNRVAKTIIDWGETDGSNELNGFEDLTYNAVNSTLDLTRSGAIMNDPNRWQPLEFATQISQNGQVLASTVQEFVGAGWRVVLPFALSRTTNEAVYLDPGAPPFLGNETTDIDFKNGVVQVIQYSSRLDPAAGVTIDISPSIVGNNTLGGNDGIGHSVNPVIESSYPTNVVNQADFARVLAEFWADGPDSETPPGHWNTLANEVVEHPSFTPMFAGQGSSLDPLEWDVKMYFLLNASVHDAAVAAWDCKRAYDYVRPISAIRYMGGLGQSTDSGSASYHIDGLPLVVGLIEEVTVATTGTSEKHEHLASHIGEIAIFAWGGEPEDPENEFTGSKWIRAVDWLPYQRDTFVTPAFAGYVSGHSAFSRAAAEILTKMTGSQFFPGGLGTHLSPAASLEFEFGPTESIELQWATYFDAADQAGESRIYGGIHVPADDGPGRVLGSQAGLGAWELGLKYFDGSILTEPFSLEAANSASGQIFLEWQQKRGLFYEVEAGTDPNALLSLEIQKRAKSDKGTLSVPIDKASEFFRIIQSE